MWLPSSGGVLVDSKGRVLEGLTSGCVPGTDETDECDEAIEDNDGWDILDDTDEDEVPTEEKEWC